MECLNCNNRFIGCHATCEAYKQYDTANKKRRAEQNMKALIVGYNYATAFRIRKKKNAMKQK